MGAPGEIPFKKKTKQNKKKKHEAKDAVPVRFYPRMASAWTIAESRSPYVRPFHSSFFFARLSAFFGTLRVEDDDDDEDDETRREIDDDGAKRYEHFKKKNKKKTKQNRNELNVRIRMRGQTEIRDDRNSAFRFVLPDSMNSFSFFQPIHDF